MLKLSPGAWIFAYMVAITMWGLMSYAELGKYLSQGVLFARSINNKPYTNDFVNTYGASKLASRCLDQKVDIYDPKIQNDQVERLVAPVVPEYPFYFQYPPHYFALVMPLSWLPLPGAWLAWNFIFNILCVTAILYLVSNETPKVRACIVLLCLASYPWWQAVQLAQAALVIFSLTVLFFELIWNKRFVAAGIATAFISIKLQYLPAFGLIGLVCGGWQFVVAAAIAMAALLGTATLLLGTENILRFPQALLMGETGKYFTGVNPFAMQNFRGELWLLVQGENPTTRIVCVVAFALSLAALAWLWWSKKRAGYLDDRLKYDWLKSVSIILMLVSSLHTHIQDYILLALPCYFAWKYLGKSGWLGERFPESSWLLFFLIPLFMLARIQPFFLWAVLLLIFVVKKQPESAAPG